MSSNLRTLPQITVGSSTPLQILTTVEIGQNWHKKESVSLQADPNNSGVVYVGDAFVSSTQYARVLNPGDWWTLSGSAIDPNRIFVLGSAASQVVHPSVS